MALMLVLVAAVVSNWSSLTSSFTTSLIRSDLADHARAVRGSALPLPDKLWLLGHLDAVVREKIGAGATPRGSCRRGKGWRGEAAPGQLRSEQTEQALSTAEGRDEERVVGAKRRRRFRGSTVPESRVRDRSRVRPADGALSTLAIGVIVPVRVSAPPSEWG
jgi:hypothetical protein